MLRMVGCTRWLGASVCLATAWAAACSAAGGDDRNAAGSGGAGAGAASGGGAAAGAGGSLFDAGSIDDGALNDATACATESWGAEKVPLDMFIMLDSSGSMGQIVGNNQTRWQAVTTALKTFFDSPDSEGMGVGLQYFALIASSGFEPECNPAEYAKADVPIAPLPGNSAALKASINAHFPEGNGLGGVGGTPTWPAEAGAVQHAKAWKAQHPDHNVIVVLATDGEPTTCNSTIENTALAAADGFNASPSIATYVIGVGPSLQNLNDIAAAGGTTSAFLVNDASATQEFIEALKIIQGTALACDYLIPFPKEGEIDFGKVNVQYTPGGGGTPVTIYQVPDAAGCDPQQGGWYYDSPPPGTPSKIIMCPATCGVLKNDEAGKVEILLGCKTITKPPT